MSLAPGEQRVLDQIDARLCQSDPMLATLMSTFTRLNCREEMPRREFLLGRRSRFGRLFPHPPPRLTSLLPVALAASALGLVFALFAAFGHPGRPVGHRISCGSPSLASCELSGNAGGQGADTRGSSQATTGAAPGAR
jgi:hypothetical protein